MLPLVAAAVAAAACPVVRLPRAPCCRPYEPDAAFQPVGLSQPKLDCSGVGLDDQQELWLLQLPLDVSRQRRASMLRPPCGGNSVPWDLFEHTARAALH